MIDYKSLYPKPQNPTPENIAYKKVYGHYQYNNNFLKQFSEGYHQGLKDAEAFFEKYYSEVYYPDY